MSARLSLGSAIRWSFLMNAARQSIGGVLTLVLAGILGPRNYGLVSMAMVYILFIQMFLEQGLNAAIIQRRDLEDEHLDSAFWLLVGLSLLLTGVSVALSGWWAGVNRVPELRDVIVVLSLSLPIQALTVVQQAILQRRLEYRALTLRSTVSVVVGGAVGLAMAVNGYGAWALVGQHLTIAGTGLVVLWGVSRWRPRLRFSWPHARVLLAFSSGSLLARIGIFAGRRSDTLLMGLFFGPAVVGIYRLADRVMRLVTEVTTRSVQHVSLAEFSRWQDHPDQLRTSVRRCLWTSATMTVVPLGILIALSSRLTSAMGPDWELSAAPLQILCVVGMLRSVAFLANPLLQAAGRPHALAVLTWCLSIPNLAILTVAAWLLRESSTGVQTVGIATMRLGMALLITVPVSIVVARTVSQTRIRDFTGALAPSLGAAALTVAVFVALPQLDIVNRYLEWLALAAWAVLASLLAGSVLLLLDARLRAECRRALGRTPVPAGADTGVGPGRTGPSRGTS